MDILKRFEIDILRPLQVALLLAAVILLYNGLWLWLSAVGLAFLYLGIIGAKLHPLQTASGLAEGPTTGLQATREACILSLEAKRSLVGHACTRVGIFIGLSAGVISWEVGGFRWYFVLALALLVTVFVGATLKVIFKTEHI